MHSIFATLEQCRAGLLDSASRQTAQLVSVAIVELRMKINRISDPELKALCDAMLLDDTRRDGRTIRNRRRASAAGRC